MGNSEKERIRGERERRERREGEIRKAERKREGVERGREG